MNKAAIDVHTSTNTRLSGEPFAFMPHKELISRRGAHLSMLCQDNVGFLTMELALGGFKVADIDTDGTKVEKCDTTLTTLSANLK